MKVNQLKSRIDDKRGSVLLWTMLFMALFFLTVSTVAVITVLEIRQSTKIDSSTEAYLLAEAGVERAKNFAYNNQEGRRTGTIGSNTYAFQVVKAAAGGTASYDNPTRSCTAGDTDKYCYYSQATVGNIRRKIDGEKSEVPLNQGKSFLQGTTTTLDANNLLDLTPDSGPIDTPSKFYLKWKVENVASLPAECIAGIRCFEFGLSDGTNGIGVSLERSSSGTNIYLADNTPNIDGVAVSSSNNNVYFELTYLVGGTATVKVTDESGRCLGVIVRSDLNFLNAPYKMFFERLSSGSGPTVSADNLSISLTSSSATVTIRNIFFRVEGGAPIGAPSLSLTAGSGFWDSFSDYLSRTLSVPFTFTNSGLGTAASTSVIELLPDNGVTRISSLPASVGNIAQGSSGSVTLKFHVPPGVNNVSGSIKASYNDTNGSQYDFSGNFSSSVQTVGGP